MARGKIRFKRASLYLCIITFAFSRFNWEKPFPMSVTGRDVHDGDEPFYEWRRNQLILQDSLVVFNFFHDRDIQAKQGTSVLAVAQVETGSRNLVNLWHQVPANATTRWWVIVIGNRLFR